MDLDDYNSADDEDYLPSGAYCIACLTIEEIALPDQIYSILSFYSFVPNVAAHNLGYAGGSDDEQKPNARVRAPKRAAAAGLPRGKASKKKTRLVMAYTRGRFVSSTLQMVPLAVSDLS